MDEKELERQNRRRQKLRAEIDGPRFDGNQAAFCAAVKKSPQQINDMLSDPPRKAFGDKVARSMAERLGYDSLYFDDGLLPSSNIAPSLTLAYYAKQHPSPIEIELRHFDTGGSMGTGVVLRDQPGVIQSWKVTPEWLSKNIRHHTGSDNLYIVTGFGDSMKPKFNPGDPLIIDAGVKELTHDGIFFFRVGEEGFIKRLQRIPGEGIRVISDNKDYESWTIRPDMDFELFGKVLKAWCSEDF